MSAGRLDDLRLLTQALLEADLVRLRRARAAVDAVEGRLQALDAATARQHAATALELEAPIAGPVFDRWGAWAERRRAELNVALARERAGHETVRADAQRAFGRTEALRLLAEVEAARRRREARRRDR